MKASLLGLMPWLGVMSTLFSDRLNPGKACLLVSLPSIKGGDLIQISRGDGLIALAASTVSCYEAALGREDSE